MHIVWNLDNTIWWLNYIFDLVIQMMEIHKYIFKTGKTHIFPECTDIDADILLQSKKNFRHAYYWAVRVFDRKRELTRLRVQKFRAKKKTQEVKE